MTTVVYKIWKLHLFIIYKLDQAHVEVTNYITRKDETVVS